MELAGTRMIAADRATVWAALNDPATLRAAIPGCSDLTGTPEEGLEATVTQKIGPVKATFKGAVSLSDVVPMESYRIAGEGKGGAAGFARGAANVALSDAEEGTRLDYVVEAHVGGKLAQLGSRLIDGVARKLADQFFDNLQQQLAPAEEEPAVAEVAAEVAAKGEPKKGWMARLRS